MSTQAIGAIQGSSKGSQDPSVQSDPQVQRLEYQIKDWSTCPTTPPAMKKQIVAQLQIQLDSAEAADQAHEKNVQSLKQISSSSPSNSSGQSQSSGKFVSPFRIDTYA